MRVTEINEEYNNYEKNSGIYANLILFNYILINALNYQNNTIVPNFASRSIFLIKHLL